MLVIDHTEAQQIIETLPSELVDVDGVPYELKIIRDHVSWAALEPIWDDLLLGTPDHSVSQSYRYQRLWWRHYGAGGQLFIVLVLHDGAVRGIAPMQIRTVRHHGRDRRMMSFIGSHLDVDRPTFLFPHDAEALSRAFVHALTWQQYAWDICDVREQSTGSPGFAALTAAFRSAGCIVGTQRDLDCPYLTLEGTWPEFLATKSSTFRKNIKTAGRRLSELGKLDYRTYDTAPNVFECLERYCAIENRSWKRDLGVGVHRRFYRELAELFSHDNGFVARVLTVDDRDVAATFGLRFNGVYYALQITHDGEFNRCSPGTYLEAREMEDCFTEGYREYDFLGGSLNNKARWTSTFRYTTHLRVYRRSLFFMALAFVQFSVKPWSEALRHRLTTFWQQHIVRRAPMTSHHPNASTSE